jgi:hypothetical protein
MRAVGRQAKWQKGGPTTPASRVGSALCTRGTKGLVDASPMLRTQRRPYLPCVPCNHLQGHSNLATCVRDLATDRRERSMLVDAPTLPAARIATIRGRRMRPGQCCGDYSPQHATPAEYPLGATLSYTMALTNGVLEGGGAA